MLWEGSATYLQVPVVDAESLTTGEGRTALPGLNQFLNKSDPRSPEAMLEHSGSR